MCVTSFVGDFYSDKWRPNPWYPQPLPSTVPYTVNTPEISRVEFDALKKEVADMKELLKRAKEYDEKNNEPACEIEEKVEILRKVAKLVGISIDDVIPLKGAPHGKAKEVGQAGQEA